MGNKLTKDEIKQLIADSLYNEELINEELYEKCSKPHIQSLPYDNRVTDEDKLDERKEEINKRVEEEEQKIKDIQKENDALEKDMYSLAKKIDDSHEKLSEYLNDMNTSLITNYEILDDLIDDLTRREGTSTDTRNAWGEQGYEDDYDYLIGELGRIQGDMDNLVGNIESSLEKGESLNVYFKYLTNMKKDAQDIYDFVDDVYNRDGNIGSLVSGANPSIKNVQDNLKWCEDQLDNYIDERKLNDSMTKTHDNLERQVDDNNLEIGKHMQIIEDYNDELDKLP